MNRREISDKELYSVVEAALVGTPFSMSPSDTTTFFIHEKYGSGLFEIDNHEFNCELIRFRLDRLYTHKILMKGMHEIDAILTTVMRQYKIDKVEVVLNE